MEAFKFLIDLYFLFYFLLLLIIFSGRILDGGDEDFRSLTCVDFAFDHEKNFKVF